MSQDIPLDAWLARLRSDDAQAQIQALRAWPRDPRAASPDAARVWKAIEHLALKADDPQVRQAALNALTSPAAQQFYHRRSTWPPAQRAALRAEIASWVAEELLSPAQAAVLQARYADPPRARPQAEAPRAPRRASPWALQVVLYLGAFFVISAALLFAALVEAWRLPILLLATGFFAVAAAAVYRITPTGGRVLGIVAAGFLWADAAALADILKPHLAADGLTLYWALATAFLALAWLAGGWLLRSFVLTLAAWPMLAVALSHGFLWLRNHFPGVRISWLLLAWAGETILAVLVARLLRARQPRLSKWLWGMTHLVAGLLLFGILPLTMIDADEGGRVTLWLPALLAYAALMLFYLLARYQIRPLPWVEAWAVPLSIAGMLQAWTALWPAGWPQALVLVAAALALATVSILLRHSKIGLSAAWSLGLEILTGLAWWAAGLALLDDPNLAQRHIWALIPWLLGAAWGWAEAWRDRRWVPGIWGWVLGLNAFVQFVAQVWPGGVNLYWSGWLLLPLLGSVALDAWAQRRGKRVVLWVARGGAFLLAGVIALQMITALGEFRLRDAGVLLILTLLLAGYARALGQPWLWAGVPVLALYTWG
ncbi:MAG: hypothetical protein GXO37_07230, partial [Chloroflexi bacterium]|nr:hypothetical protein [Chloroflexota bacterium]